MSGCILERSLASVTCVVKPAAKDQTQTQTKTHLFRQDYRKSTVSSSYLSRLRSCEQGREQEGKLEIAERINKDRKRWKKKEGEERL